MSGQFGKRAFDIVFASVCLVITSPILALVALALCLQDFHSPIYRGQRIGRHGKPFVFLKFRSMVVDAGKSSVDTTSANDPRITPVGRVVRRGKIDELPQFWNVILGDMSVVGPRPQVPREVAIYTDVEKRLMDVQPGITDLASIVFADLDRIVASEPDPDIAYNQLVRPWKSRLGLFYIDNRDFSLDLAVVALTVLNVVWRAQALTLVAALLRQRGAPPELVAVAERKRKLVPTPPPGTDQVVQSRAVPVQ